MDDLNELLGMIVSESVCEAMNAFLDEFEKGVDRQDPSLDMAKITQNGQVCIFKFETPEKAMAVVHKEGRYAVDLNAHDPKSGLLEVDKAQYDKLMERAYTIEKKYTAYNVITTGELEDMLRGHNVSPEANADQEDEMLNTCLKILDTIDGKEKHYKNLNHKTYGHVTIVLDGDEFIAALTASGGSILGNTNVHSVPHRYSKSVSDAMRATHQAVNEKLPNTIPEGLMEVLPSISARFNALSDEEKQNIVNHIRRKRKG